MISTSIAISIFMGFNRENAFVSTVVTTTLKGDLKMTSSFNLSFNFVTVEEEPLLHPLEASVLAALAFVILLVGLVVQVRINLLCLKSLNNAFCLSVLFTLPFSQQNTLWPAFVIRTRSDYTAC
jgi:hypothetical protein